MAATKAIRTAGRQGTAKKARKLSRTNRPSDLTLHEWQTELRRQFGRAQAQEFTIRNLGKHPVFSEFSVTNPASKRTYRVAIRGHNSGVNFCSCPDFAVNQLGTCKHIEGILGRLERRYVKVLRAGFAPPYAEVYVRYGPRRAVLFSPGTKCSTALTRLAGHYFAKDGELMPDSFATFDRFLQSAAKIDDELRVYDDASALIADVRDSAARRKRLADGFSGKAGHAAWDRLLKVTLFPYQKEGTLFAAQAGRAIIADEMGLGKTIQAIAAAEILARDSGVERVLVVCPASLKSQWQHEIGQFSTRTALILEGPTFQRTRQYRLDPSFFKITNYDVVHRDLEAIAAWAPDLVILDEAQRIKNWQTRTAQNVKRIESRFALVLTGTPLENRIEELHSIVEYIDRYRLGPHFAFKAAHQVCEKDSDKVIGYRDLNKINQTLAPILIRRSKKEVLSQLPPRMDKNFFVPMTEQQWTPHDENKEIVARIVAKWRRYKFLTEADQLRLRIALQNMRMSCDSTYLIDHETKHGTKIGELATLLEEVFERDEAKVVIFSQWVRMNELVIEMLEDRRWGHVHLHGGVPARERKHLTQALREDKNCRVFLSTDAGGVGLNLQTASTIINMDLPWNPAVLEQRIGRVHRLGQKNPVRVVNFVSQSTIEHGMLSLLSFKKSLFAGVLDGAADRVFMGDSALNRFMKTVEAAASATPQAVPAVTEPEESAILKTASAPIASVSAPITPMTAADIPAPSDSGSSFLDRPNGASMFDARSLGELLTQGASLLQALGRSLAEPEAKSAKDGSPSALHPLFSSISRDGRPELRIPLPDAQTMQSWLNRLAGLLNP